MLRLLMKSLIRGGAGKPGKPVRVSAASPVRLHVGGQVVHPDWKILDVRPGPQVDYVAHCSELSAFDDASVLEIYASHVIEHLGYLTELPAALREFNRVLVPGGRLRASVPDLATLCTLFVDPSLNADERFHVMRMMFGGQTDKADFHYVGLDEAFLTSFLQATGFTEIVRVGEFGVFADASSLVFKGRAISLNLCARKPGSAPAG